LFPLCEEKKEEADIHTKKIKGQSSQRTDLSSSAFDSSFPLCEEKKEDLHTKKTKGQSSQLFPVLWQHNLLLGKF